MDNSTKIVVSLTVIPPRFNDLGKTLNSLLDQSRRADAIEVTIPKTYRRFPDHVFRLPDVPDGVDVIVSDEDLGPASKVLPCAQRYRDTNTRIVYCDDDRIAPKDWLRSLTAKSMQYPQHAIISSGTDLDRLGVDGIQDARMPRAVRQRSRVDLNYRMRRLGRIIQGLASGQKLPKPGRNPFKTDGYVDIAEGLGGVSVSPEFFDAACFDIPAVVWAVDDIWLSGCLERQGIGIWADSACQGPTEHDGAQHAALAASTIEDADRHNANLSCVRYMQETYGIWPQSRD